MNRRCSQAHFAVVCLTALLFLVVSTLSFAQSSKVQIYRELKHDSSPELKDLIRMTPEQANPFSPRVLDILPTGHNAKTSYTEAPDAALQEQVTSPTSATIGLNFEGLGLGTPGFGICCAPPDTNGAVGATQYVQWVNLSFAVYNKNTGARVAGPTAGNALWAGFGGTCETNNSGDPIVQYDKIANRWVLTQFQVNSQPFLQCVAVSKTSDATGAYNRYSFSFSNQFNDYPKMGVWPDAYYISFNNFLNGQSFTGPNACAMDRTAMLAGTAATIQCFQQASSFSTLLPSDMDGTIQPSAGEPGFFLDFGVNKLNLWKFHVDFAHPANSTLTGPTALTVANFTQGCNRSCVAQPGTTNRLDMLGDRMMYRLAYRKFADHEALFASHTITTGYRWYELRDPNGTPTVFQQGTFAPDSTTRWMGSIAADQTGNIAVGYTLGSSAKSASVYITGRAPSDPAGTLGAEQVIVDGTGAQTSPTRWGDYSAMTVDPADDCTFWYTQEYSNTTGSFAWSTRIANFKLPGCGGGGGGPAVSLTPTLLKWGKILVGVKSGAKTVTLTNTGTATLNISSITTTGDFAQKIVAKSCKSTVAAGASCLIKVTFTPTQLGVRTGTLTISDDAPDTPQTVSLSGTGK